MVDLRADDLKIHAGIFRNGRHIIAATVQNVPLATRYARGQLLPPRDGGGVIAVKRASPVHAGAGPELLVQFAIRR